MAGAPRTVGPVAIIAPGGRDAAVIGGILRTVGIIGDSPSSTELAAGIASAHFAAAVIAEER